MTGRPPWVDLTLVIVGGVSIGAGLVAGTEVAAAVRGYLARRRRRDVPSRHGNDSH